MKKIYNDGEIDYSDEGEQSRAITSEIEVNRFYSTLSKRQQIVLTYLLAKEDQSSIARFLGVNEMEVSRDLKQIRKSWVEYKKDGS